jgi:lipopolysaccharide heptosyltransferase II
MSKQGSGLPVPENILISRLSSIGDIVLTTPVIRAVRKKYPDARITFLIKKQFASLVQHNPFINKVITFDRSDGSASLRSLSDEIRKEQFDWMIDLHNNLRTNYLRYSCRIPLITTYSKQTFKRILLVRAGKSFFGEIKPVYLKYFEALRTHQIVYDQNGTEVYFDEEVNTAVNLQLESDKVGEEDHLCVICPGASFSNKQWLPERFAETADDLITTRNFKVVFLGGKGDASLCDSIIRIMKYPALNYAGQLSLTGSAAMLKRAVLVITNDSGMMHLAQSQKTAVVAIFGPTTRELGFFPLPDKSAVVEKMVKCRPCTTKGLNYCPMKHFQCMNLIETADVLSAAYALSGT